MVSYIFLKGLDGSGKTTILYKLNLGDTVTTIPTIGFNLEKVRYKNVELTCWDIGGQKKIRSLWHHYYEGTDAIIFVIDSNDKKRMNEVKQELRELLSHHYLEQATLLIYANKQDVKNCLNTSEVNHSKHMKNIAFI